MLIILILAVMGLLTLPQQLKMAWICFKIVDLFERTGYPELDIRRISVNTGFNPDEIVTACIADKRMEQVMPGCYEIWRVAKHWRRHR